MSLEAIMSQYEDNTKSSNGNFTPKKVDLTQYFSTFLPKGVKEATKTIRILPGEKTPFTKIHVHSKKIDGNYRKLICLKEMKGEDCPFCEAFEGLMEKDTEEHRKVAYKQYKPREAYVVKVIDRDKEGEGVKFWRFNHSRQKDGIYDQIINSMLAAKEDFSDPETGRDITIKISRNQAGIPVVSSIIASFHKSKLNEDDATAKLWLSDERTWEDVYAIKDYEYLRILVEGGEPVWDKEKKGYVSKDTQSDNDADDSSNDSADLDKELVMGGNTTTPSTPKTETTPKVETKPTEVSSEDDSEDEDDDLPF